MTFVAKNYSNAEATTLAEDCDDTQTQITINAPAQTWPRPTFTIAIDRGAENQEVCLVQTATNVLGVVRNYDGNGAFAHRADAIVEIAVTAQDLQNFNIHMMDQSRDDHPTLMRVDGRGHNDPARHMMGVSLPSGLPTTSRVGDPYQPGDGDYLARADHVHGRADTWTTYTDAMMIPGLVLPITDAATDPRLLLCDGGYYNQATYPKLYAAIGNRFQPSLLPRNPGTGTGTYSPALHFATPLLGQVVGTTVQWNYLGTKWAIVADAL